MVNAATDGIHLKMTWNTGGYDNGRPCTVTVTIDGAATVGLGPGEAHSITVKACAQGEPTNCSSKSDSARPAFPSATLHAAAGRPPRAGDRGKPADVAQWNAEVAPWSAEVARWGGEVARWGGEVARWDGEVTRSAQ